MSWVVCRRFARNFIPQNAAAWINHVRISWERGYHLLGRLRSYHNTTPAQQIEVVFHTHVGVKWNHSRSAAHSNANCPLSAQSRPRLFCHSLRCGFPGAAVRPITQHFRRSKVSSAGQNRPLFWTVTQNFLAISYPVGSCFNRHKFNRRNFDVF